MFTIIWDFLNNNYPQIAGYFVVALIISYCSIKFTIFYKEARKTYNDHQGIKDKLNLLLDKFSSLIAALHAINIIKDPKYFSTNSPINLTSEGKKFIEEIGWKKIIEDKQNQKLIFELLNKLHLKTKADVERYCIVILDELYSSRDINPFTEIKQYLYDHADIDRQSTITACALYLRNKYLDAHPKIK